MVGINIRLRLENHIADAVQQGILGSYFETQRHNDDRANNPNALLDRIRTFLNDAPPKMDLLERQLADADFEACRNTLLNFTGECAAVGGGRVVPSCLQLSRHFYDQDQALCLDLLAGVKEEYNLLVQTVTQMAEMEAELVEHHNLRREWRIQRQRQND